MPDSMSDTRNFINVAMINIFHEKNPHLISYKLRSKERIRSFIERRRKISSAKARTWNNNVNIGKYLCTSHGTISFLFSIHAYNIPWAFSVFVGGVRNFGRSSPATISFWWRRSGDDFVTGTNEPVIVRTWGGGATSNGDASSEHCESHSEKERKKIFL